MRTKKNKNNKNDAKTADEIREKLKREKFALVGELKPKALELTGGLEWGGTPTPSYLLGSQSQSRSRNKSKS